MRINVIPVKFLSDQHLVAEYREIKMLPKALTRSLKSKHGLNKSKISKHYILNTGHGYFFYNKIPYIENRFSELCDEMKCRGFTLNYTDLYSSDYDYSFMDESVDYTPNADDIKISADRIIQRIHEMFYVKHKPNFYKFNGTPMSYQEWENFYLNMQTCNAI